MTFKAEDKARVVRVLKIDMRHVGFEIHLRTPTGKHLCLIFLFSCQEEMQPRPALIFKANHFEMVIKGRDQE